MESLDDWDEDLIRNVVCPSEETAALEKKAAAKFSLTSRNVPDGDMKEELAKQVSAFSNSGDGVLVYGINEQKQLDEGVPIAIGNQSTKDWVEAMIPKLIYPSVTGCEARLIPIGGHHSPGRALLAITIPLSERRPHWVVAPTEVAYIRAGAHSLPMRPQTLLDVASRGPSSVAEIVGINSNGVPRITAGADSVYFINPLVKLISGHLARDWAFELKASVGRLLVTYLNKGGVVTSKKAYFCGTDPLFVGRVTPVSQEPFSIAISPTGTTEIEAVLYLGSSAPIKKVFRIEDLNSSEAPAPHEAEIIHFAGPSCVGKRELIKRLFEPRESSLRRRFGIHGTLERYFQDTPEDVDFNRAYDPTPWRPIDEILAPPCDHALHKWQERSHNWIDQIRLAKIPQRVYLLWRPCEQVMRRIRRKGLWFPDIHSTAANIQNIVRMFDPVRQSEISVEIVNATTALYDRMETYPIEIPVDFREGDDDLPNVV